MMLSLFEDLVHRGADINTRNKKGETPLFEFASLPRNDRRFAFFIHSQENKEEAPEMPAMAMLERLRADFFARDNKGLSLLHVAASGNDVRFKELMAKGLDVMMEDEAQQTPIDVAAAAGNEGVLALFEKKD
jgi:ankyrin repeat protein